MKPFRIGAITTCAVRDIEDDLIRVTHNDGSFTDVPVLSPRDWEEKSRLSPWWLGGPVTYNSYLFKFFHSDLPKEFEDEGRTLYQVSYRMAANLQCQLAFTILDSWNGVTEPPNLDSVTLGGKPVYIDDTVGDNIIIAEKLGNEHYLRIHLKCWFAEKTSYTNYSDYVIAEIEKAFGDRLNYPLQYNPECYRMSRRTWQDLLLERSSSKE